MHLMPLEIIGDERMQEDLKLIERDWKRQGLQGDIPAALFESLISGARGWEKRVVKNIAYHTPLFRDDGSIKEWSEIVSEWDYVKSTIGPKTDCSICGKNPIIENCILQHHYTGEKLIIGNTCVIRYITITIDGVTLTDDEKKEFLTGKMTEARKEYHRKEFMLKCPSVWDDLTRYEDTLTRHDPSLLKSMVRRMRSHGFPGKILEQKWMKFLSRAVEIKERVEIDARNERRREEKIRETLRSRAANRSAHMELLRKQRQTEGRNISTFITENQEYIMPVEKDRLDKMSERLVCGGTMNGSDRSLLSAIDNRIDRIQAGPQDNDDPLISFLWDLDPEPLTNAERLFRWQVIGKGQVDNGDKSAIRRMRIRYS